MLSMCNTDDQNPKNVILNIAYKAIITDTKTPVLPQFSLQAFRQISRLIRSRDSLAQISGYAPCDWRVDLIQRLARAVG